MVDLAGHGIQLQHQIKISNTQCKACFYTPRVFNDAIFSLQARHSKKDLSLGEKTVTVDAIINLVSDAAKRYL